MTIKHNQSEKTLGFENSKTFSRGMWKDPSISKVMQDIDNLSPDERNNFHSSIEVLSISNHEIEKGNAAKIAEYINKFDQLRVLRLGGTHLIPTKATRMMKSGKGENKFERIELFSKHLDLQHPEKIIELDLSSNEINDDRIEKFVQLIAKFENLKYLHLNNNNLSPRSVRLLCQQLSVSNRYLTEVSLDGNKQIKANDITALNETLFERCQKHEREDRNNQIPGNAVQVIGEIGVVARKAPPHKSPTEADLKEAKLKAVNKENSLPTTKDNHGQQSDDHHDDTLLSDSDDNDRNVQSSFQ